MKIICIGRNYLKHARELEHDIPTEPVFFMKPDSALLLDNRHFYLPGFSNEIHYEVELVIKINRLGKTIEARYAHRYYDEIGLGVDFTARDVQRHLIEKGLPWEKAKAFDSSAASDVYKRQGVPVKMRSPILRVTNCETCSIMVSTAKIISLEFPC